MEFSGVSINDLAKACARSADAAEWDEFLRLSTPLATIVTVRVCRMWTGSSSPALVDDIVQEIFLRLCERERQILRDFEPRGEDSFFGMLRIVSASVANDYFRRISSAKRGGRVITASFDDEVPPRDGDDSREAARILHSALLGELDRKLGSAPEIIGLRDRAMFWLYYLQGLTAEEIARVPSAGLTAKGVESALRRVANWLRSQLEDAKPKPEG
jgi:RNA polymerase sigma-70 factor (ECF subfamily)